jgi:glycosyltransferase involved in cell wall biosynthesis
VEGTPVIPTVSVCIPVRNGERFLGATLESVLGQTFEDLELIVCDNCSTDGTMDILHAVSDHRLRVFQNEHDLGAIANWNRVAGSARGAYVKLLPADDLLARGALERQVAVMADPAHHDVVLVSGKRDIIDESGRVLLEGRGLAGLRGVVPGHAAIRSAVRAGTNPFGEPAAVLARADALSAALPMSDRWPYLVDLDLWCRLLQRGDLYAMQETVAAFRIVQGSESVGIARQQAAQTRAFFRSLRQQPALNSTIRASDYRLGTVMATGNAWARRAVYASLRWAPAAILHRWSPRRWR